jgi:hypothetical protein
MIEIPLLGGLVQDIFRKKNSVYKTENESFNINQV